MQGERGSESPWIQLGSPPWPLEVDLGIHEEKEMSGRFSSLAGRMA